MPSDDSPVQAPRRLGPVAIRDASLGKQLPGFALALVGCLILDWAASTTTPLGPTVLYTALGIFVVCNGLYVGGVRVR